MLHNCVIDTKSRHDVTPLLVTKRLDFECIGPCKYLIDLDSRIVEKMGYMKVLSISFNQAPNVSMLIHVIVVEILEAYGVLLGRDWSTKVKKVLYLMEGTHFTFHQ